MIETSKTYGKLIWMGEHSVVYGHPALALPLKSASVSTYCETSTEDRIRSRFYTGTMDEADARFESLSILILALRKALALPPQTLVIETDLPIGAGLGASAAIAASIVKAMYQTAGVVLTSKALQDWIDVSETVAHGKPSGIDAATVVSDTAITFVKGGAPMPFFLNVPGFLFVADSGVFGSTKEAVALVKKKTLKKAGKALITRLGSLTDRFLSALERGSSVFVGKQMNEAHAILRALGVSHPTLDQMVALALAHGAEGAKMTGGGLGGCMIAYCRTLSSVIRVRDAFVAQGQNRHWILDLQTEFGNAHAVTARAPINIALIKYWGKRDEKNVLPTAPSLSLSLSRFETITRIQESAAPGVTFTLNGEPAPEMIPRVQAFLTQFTNKEEPDHLRIDSVNTGPTAAGLASSASAFAALAIAADRYYQTHDSLSRLAEITRKGSGSAVRSLLPSAVSWNEDGSIEAVPMNLTDIKMAILIVSDHKKDVSSTEGMKHTMATSPLYSTWIDSTRRQFARMKEALKDGDFASVGALAEENALKLHGLCSSAVPPIDYLTKESRRIIQGVQNARADGLFQAYCTMDAGPNVKLLCQAHDQSLIDSWIASQGFPKPIWSNIDTQGAVIWNE